MDNPLIELQNLTVGYQKKAVISDIYLSLYKGKVLTLIGPNGSGKSTVLKTITKELKPINGAVYIAGRDIASMKNSDMAKTLSMVLTERVRPELMTCREVVATGRYPYTGNLGILSKEDWEIVDNTIELLNASETSDKYITEISDGQRQRVMLARAICQDTEILILDEPTSYLDMRYKLDILNNIRLLSKKNNIAVIMSLHELDLARQVSDYIACVDGARISQVGTPEEVFTGDIIAQLYGINNDCFDSLTGSMYMTGNKEKPKLFVIGGGGKGVSLYNNLKRDNIPFAAGIISENDIEYGLLKAASSKVISVGAFMPITNIDIDKAKECIDECEMLVSTVDTFYELNKRNEELIEYAKECNKYTKLEDIWQRL